VSQIFTVSCVEDALQAIDAFTGEPGDFVLRIANSAIGPLLIDGQQVTGMQMAQITDRILKRGWWPTGFSEDGDFRLYSYKEF
jgi:hypothetical protein